MNPAVVNVLHLADLHFGAGHANALIFSKILDPLVALINSMCSPPVIILGGDITFKGMPHGYAEAVRFFETAQTAAGLKGSRFLVCPGNHDIVPPKYAGGIPEGFKELNRFTYTIRRDKNCNFETKTCVSVEIDSIYFLLINSAFHLDKTYGFVNLDGIEAELRSHPPSAVCHSRIAVVHHHPIPISRNDISTIRNAYGLLALLDKTGFGALLHGHQHTTMGLRVGTTPVLIYGVGSFNYYTRGRLNGLNIYGITSNSIRPCRRTLLTDGHAGDATGYGAVIPPPTGATPGRVE